MFTIEFTLVSVDDIRISGFMFSNTNQEKKRCNKLLTIQVGSSYETGYFLILYLFHLQTYIVIVG